jgi:probable sporulation protein (polysaccharide deacetylase family)
VRLFIVSHVPRWYLTFAVGVFLTVSVIASLVNSVLNPAAVKQQPIFHGNPAQPRVAFACNVFWGEEYLPRMLDTLDSQNIKITFFIGGSWAKRFPDQLKLLADRGHELANHSYSHPHPNTLGKQNNQEQIIRTEELIREITGQTTNLYAPPYGEYNDLVLEAANDLKYKTIMWSIDTIDWQRPSPTVLHNRVMKKLHNGAIILMHPTAPTAEALPGLIKAIQSSGYTITTVSDILE